MRHCNTSEQLTMLLSYREPWIKSGRLKNETENGIDAKKGIDSQYLEHTWKQDLLVSHRKNKIKENSCLLSTESLKISKPRMKSKHLHKNKQMVKHAQNWRFLPVKAIKSWNSLSNGSSSGKKMAFFNTDFVKFKERSIWHSAFNSRKLLSDAGGSL